MNYNEKRTVLKLVRRKAADALNAYTRQVQEQVGVSQATFGFTKEQFMKDWKEMKAARTKQDKADKAQRALWKRQRKTYTDNVRFLDSWQQDWGNTALKAWNELHKYATEDARYLIQTKEMKVAGNRVILPRPSYRSSDASEATQTIINEAVAKTNAAMLYLELDIEAEVLLGDDTDAKDMMKSLSEGLAKILS